MTLFGIRDYEGFNFSVRAGGGDGIIESLRGIPLGYRKRVLSLRHDGKGQDSQADYRMHPTHGNLL